jgi:hypothetical protein
MDHTPPQALPQERPRPSRPLHADDVSALHDLICAVAGALVLAAAAMGFLAGCTGGAPIAAGEPVGPVPGPGDLVAWLQELK